MKEKRDCKIVQDLLPNYIEKLTNEETNLFIEEHLKDCRECRSILENMKKDIKIDEEKRDSREVDYIKKYNKKMRLWKKIGLVILCLFVLYLFTVLYRYTILTKIEERNEISNSSTNYYYKSISNDTIMECYKKEGITKVNLKQMQGDGDITFWKDENTGEEYCFWNAKKTYSENAGGIMATAPCSMTSCPDFTSRLIIALNPLVFIGTQKYNDIACYNIRFDGLYEIIEKKSGLVLYSSDESYMRMIEYSFDTVTDKDVEKPNLAEYSLNH